MWAILMTANCAWTVTENQQDPPTHQRLQSQNSQFRLMIMLLFGISWFHMISIFDFYFISICSSGPLMPMKQITPRMTLRWVPRWAAKQAKHLLELHEHKSSEITRLHEALQRRGLHSESLIDHHSSNSSNSSSNSSIVFKDFFKLCSSSS